MGDAAPQAVHNGLDPATHGLEQHASSTTLVLLALEQGLLLRAGVLDWMP